MHYHFIGIGGIGMGTLASLILAKGHQVSGSDVAESPMTASLREKGAQISIGHRYEQGAGADYVIFSSAIRPDNPELKAAQDRNIPILKRAQLLARIMENHDAITIAGAHGKTTTTSMTSQLLLKAGLNPTTAVGGIINGISYNANLGDGRYFVAEVDESDGSFLYFSPRYSLITNIDYEHVDYYHTWDNILAAYRQFIQRTHPDGLVIGCGDDARLKDLLSRGERRFITYGFLEGNDVRAENIQIVKDGPPFLHFECLCKKEPLGAFCLSVPGQHNILNAMAVIALGVHLKIDVRTIEESLRIYQGVKRRFQRKGLVHDILFVDDYGHHPTEITATLRAAHAVKKNRLITIFQPHRYTRTKFLMDEFAASLAESDYLIVTDIYAASETPIEGVTSQVLYEKILRSGKKDVCYLRKDNIPDHVLRIARPGDMVLTLGAGDIYRVGEQCVEALKNRYKDCAPVTGEHG